MRIFESFMRSKPLKVYSYLFIDHPEHLSNMRKQLDSRSVANALAYMLTIQNDEDDGMMMVSTFGEHIEGLLYGIV